MKTRGEGRRRGSYPAGLLAERRHRRCLARTRILGSLYAQVLVAVVIGAAIGFAYPETGVALKPLGRRLHQADQDDDRADHLLHGRARHLRHGGHEEGRQDRRARPALFRGREHDRAGDRAGRSSTWSQPGRRRERRPGHARCRGRATVRAAAGPHGVADHVLAHHPDPRSPAPSPTARCCRCCCSPCCSASRCTRSAARKLACSSSIEQLSARAVPHRRLHHAARAARRVRRDGVHDRQVRHRRAALARQADGLLLRHLPAVHLRGARRHRAGANGFSIWRSSATSGKNSSSCWARPRRNRCCRG